MDFAIFTTINDTTYWGVGVPSYFGHGCVKIIELSPLSKKNRPLIVKNHEVDHNSKRSYVGFDYVLIVVLCIGEPQYVYDDGQIVSENVERPCITSHIGVHGYVRVDSENNKAFLNE